MNSKLFIVTFLIAIISTLVLSMPVQQQGNQVKSKLVRNDGKTKTRLPISNEAFGLFGATHTIHLNAMKHKKNAINRQLKSKPKTVATPPCMISTSYPPVAETFQPLSKRGNTLFTSHNWGGH